MSTITIVTIWNKQEIFSEFVSALKRQEGVDYTLLAIENADNRYTSAREAFNAQLGKIETELVLFLHQDIRFLDEHALRDILAYVEKLGEFGVAGVAGCPEGEVWKICSGIVHGQSARPAGQPVQAPVEVQTVDECMFFMRLSQLKAHPFSDLAGWHMYAVEQCMELRRAGLRNYVVPARIWHLSKGGSLDATYIKTLERLIARYAGDTEHLNTTVKQWNTRGLKARLYRAYYLRKLKLKRYLQTRFYA